MTNRAVFIDRDGTLIEHYDYLTDPSQVQLLPSTVSALKLLRQHGFLLIVITNQSAVARGMLTEKTLNQIHDHLKSLLGREGAYIDRIYYCPYHPEAVVDQYRRDSDLRKPKPGMLNLAKKELNIDLDHSWIVGDDDRDIETGRTVGCRTIMLESRGSSLVRKGQSSPNFTAVNLQEAANLIIHHSRPEEPPTKQTSPQIEDQPEKPTEEKSTEAIEQTSEPETPPPPTEPQPPQPEDSNTTNHQLTTEQDKTKVPGQTDTETFLAHILRELKAINRDRNMPAEFSIGKLMAGVVQMLVIFCLVLAFWFGTSPEPKTGATQNCLLLALIFQTLTLTLLLIHRH
ncbi:MAG: HAD family hydrolase [Sedimentisphaerales bacterium]|nr:HAD family hydrolase [Sedimentisphaerales bacterium]